MSDLRQVRLWKLLGHRQSISLNLISSRESLRVERRRPHRKGHSFPFSWIIHKLHFGYLSVFFHFFTVLLLVIIRMFERASGKYLEKWLSIEVTIFELMKSRILCVFVGKTFDCDHASYVAFLFRKTLVAVNSDHLTKSQVLFKFLSFWHSRYYNLNINLKRSLRSLISWNE